jgi:hypothetical protein
MLHKAITHKVVALFVLLLRGKIVDMFFVDISTFSFAKEIFFTNFAAP